VFVVSFLLIPFYQNYMVYCTYFDILSEPRYGPETFAKFFKSPNCKNKLDNDKSGQKLRKHYASEKHI